MVPLNPQDRESELSYAYIHAVAAKVGMGCAYSTRHADNHGVDAQITAWGEFPGEGTQIRDEIDIKVQLKATTQTLRETETHYSYFLSGIERYNDLRSLAMSIPRILVVLRLPNDETQWIDLNEERFLLRHCAYWVSLKGAPPSNNRSGATVYLPKLQIFNPIALLDLVTKISRCDIPTYEAPK